MLLAAQADLNVGTAFGGLGRYEDALHCYQNAFRRFEEIGDQRGSLLSLCNLGEIQMALGQDEAALSCLEQALFRSDAIGEAEDKPYILCLLGQGYARRGDLARASERLEQAIIAADQSENPGTREEEVQLLARLQQKDG